VFFRSGEHPTHSAKFGILTAYSGQSDHGDPEPSRRRRQIGGLYVESRAQERIEFSPKSAAEVEAEIAKGFDAVTPAVLKGLKAIYAEKTS